MIYCDLDGVLADFNGTFKKLTGKYPFEISRNELWKNVSAIPEYWLKLGILPDADILLTFLSKYPYQILTGLPQQGYDIAETEKRQWVQKYINPQIKVICCLSKDKALYCQKGDILIDDFEPNIRRWENAGGIGILHQNAQNTVQILSRLLGQSTPEQE